MKKVLLFTYSIVAYLIAFASIVYWILSVSNLVPEISIDQQPRLSFVAALLNNLLLIALFGLQHSIMARPWFKKIFEAFLPKPAERSTFVLISGILLALMVINWEPMGGVIWEVQSGTALYYIIYTLFFTGWVILFVSTFIINHFDLFGIRQTYLELIEKPYTALDFSVKSFYKYMRHPLYFGMMLGMWATATMTVTHMVFAVGITIYAVIGTWFEEKDLVKEFGMKYKLYQEKKPKFIPFTKRINKNMKQVRTKSLIILLLLSLISFEILSQNIEIQDVINDHSILEEVASIHPNTDYYEVVHKSDFSIEILSLQERIDKYEIADHSIYDNSEKALYHVLFRRKMSRAEVIFNNEGEILSSKEQYKNIKLPLELTRLILEQYPNHIIESNRVSISYSQNNHFSLIYKIVLVQGKKRKTLQFDKDFKRI